MHTSVHPIRQVVHLLLQGELVYILLSSLPFPQRETSRAEDDGFKQFFEEPSILSSFSWMSLKEEKKLNKRFDLIDGGTHAVKIMI